MHLYGIRVFEQREKSVRKGGGQAGMRLRAIAAVMLTLTAGVPPGFAQQNTGNYAGYGDDSDQVGGRTHAGGAGADPNRATEPARYAEGFFEGASGFASAIRSSCTCPPASQRRASANSVRLGDLVKDGKIYLSLSDALALALENNYDIAISRYYMDLADLDILRAKAARRSSGRVRRSTALPRVVICRRRVPAVDQVPRPAEQLPAQPD